jgi:hypothetical protein
VIGAPVVAPPATTVTQQYPIVPAPLGVGLGVASASVSPSPFAPPPASAPIAGPVSHPLPRPSSSSTNLTAKAKSPDVVQVHPDQLALSSDLDADEHPAGSEYVMEHASVSTLHPEGPGGNSTADHLNAFTHDPPDSPQPRAPSRQVCLSSRAVLHSACVYAYESCDRVQCYRLWIPPIAPRHQAPPHGARRRLLCSFLRRLRVYPLTPSPTLFLQKNPTHQKPYPYIRHRRHHHRHRRCVDLVAVTHGSSPRPTSKDGK